MVYVILHKVLQLPLCECVFVCEGILLSIYFVQVIRSHVWQVHQHTVLFSASRFESLVMLELGAYTPISVKVDS